MNKKRVTENLQELCDADICGLIECVCEYFNKLKDVYEQKGYTNLRISVSEGRCYECEGHSTFWLVGDRDETDDERKKRVNEQKKVKQNEEARKQKELLFRRNMYEELKKEFDPPTKFIPCKRPKTIEEIQEDAADKRLYGRSRK